MFSGRTWAVNQGHKLDGEQLRFGVRRGLSEWTPDEGETSEAEKKYSSTREKNSLRGMTNETLQGTCRNSRVGPFV